LHVEQDSAQDFLQVAFPALLAGTFQDQPEILDMPGQGMLVYLHGYPLLPVVAVTHLPVALLAMLVHVLAEPLLHQGAGEIPRLVLALGGVPGCPGGKRAQLRHGNDHTSFAMIRISAIARSTRTGYLTHSQKNLRFTVFLLE